MALLATFVGINKHSDPGISDLTGAAKDATAVWALFKDSVTHLQGSLLLDKEAPKDALEKDFERTFGAAGPDDTVLFYFAGHGTPAHQLVPFDAQKLSINDSTIPMEVLAEYLKTTQARASIIILDCCFSGAAPARVLSDIPIPRSTTTTLTDLDGKGRIIIAASKDNEAAWEMGDHGLLTGALLQYFRDNPTEVDVGTMMDSVSKEVQANAKRMGSSQTPVWLGLIEGGFRLPALKPGAHFSQAFPDTIGIEVTAKIQDLQSFGLPANLLNIWTKQFPDGLNDLQLTAINKYRVLDGKSLLVVAPTSSGKTFVGELAAAKAIVDGRKAVFLLPFRALTNEKYEDFSALYGEQMDLRVIRCTGDFADQTDQFVRGKYDIALLTYEMFLNLSLAVPSLLNKIGLVVLDEAQFITESNRGISVELLLTNLLTARDRGIEPQLLALSAVIGEVNSFDAWLGCQTLYTTERPVPLTEGVLDRSGTYQYITPEGEERTDQLLASHEIVAIKKSSSDLIIPLVRKLVAQGEKVLIFRNSRGATAGCANYLANGLELPPAQDVINLLPELDPSNTTESLRRALSGGTAFHNSNLTRDERVLIERSFRDPEGSVHALAATSTVAAGVNTPASTVIIVETFFYGNPPEQYSIAGYKNMAGRAGRLGLTEEGRCILIAETEIKRRNLFKHYVLGEPEPIRSSFDPDDIHTWVLRLLSQVRQVQRDQIVALLANTYGGYLANRNSAKWQNQIKERLESVLSEMIKFSLIEEEGDLVQLSLLGHACGRSTLSFKSALKLLSALQNVEAASLTATKLMAYVQVLPEIDDSYTPMFKRGNRESERQRDVVTRYGHEVAKILQFGAGQPLNFYARCKRAAVLWDWIQGTPIEEIERHYTINFYQGNLEAGDIRGMANQTRFVLRSAYEVADVLLFGAGPDAESIEALLTQLEFGLPADALGLVKLPIRLSRGEYLALYQAGYNTPEDVLKLSETELKKIIRAENALRLQHTA